MSLLEIQNLSIEIRNRQAVKKVVGDISYQVEAGEIIGIIGASGSGKSISMLGVMGLLPQNAVITQGRILFEGEEAVQTKLRGRGIAMVLQDSLTGLNPTLRIGTQLVETVRTHHKCTRKEAVWQAISLLEQVGITSPKERMKQYPFEFSGGMRQRVVIAIALACEPKLIIADEPTTSLDVTVQAQILDLLKKTAKDTGAAIILISHDLAVVGSLCRRILVMQGGQIVERKMADEMLRGRKEINVMGAVHTHGKRKVSHDNILTVRHVTKGFVSGMAYDFFSTGSQTEAVEDVTFSIERGTTFGLVGESGCGKSTLARLLVGAYEPEQGEIYYGECRIDRLSEKERKPYHQKIQMIFQDPYASLNPRFTVEEIMEEPLIASGWRSAVKRKEKVAAMMEAVGLLEEDKKKYPHEFSGGQRQRIGIGRALILEPDLVVCDEPVSSLDAATQMQMIDLLERLQKERGLSYLFIAHDLEMVSRISQMVGVMYSGSLVEAGPTDEVYGEPWHPYTKSLLSYEPVSDCGREDGQCPFAHRCPYVMDRCMIEKPGMYRHGERYIFCFLYADKGSKDNFAYEVGGRYEKEQ